MPSILRTSAAALAAAALVATAAAPADAHRSKGGGLGVVLAQTDADTFVVADRGGQLRSIDAATPPAVGSVVKIKQRRRAATTVRVVGTTASAKVRGYVATSAAASFTLSSRDDDDADIVIGFAAPITQPTVGLRAKVTVAIADGKLTATSVKLGEPERLEIEGKLTAVDTALRTLTVAPESGDPVAVEVPAAFDLAQFKVGASVELKVTLEADGTSTLVAVDRDDDRSDAPATSSTEDRPSRGGDDHPKGSDDRKPETETEHGTEKETEHGTETEKESSDDDHRGGKGDDKGGKGDDKGGKGRGRGGDDD